MDTSEPRVRLQGVAKIFKAGLKSKTWDIHGMPQFITTTHREGCEMCDMYTSHVVKASEALMVEIPSREAKKAFWIAWPNIVCHIEDEASSVSDKKVEWYSNHHDNLSNDVRMVENEASAERDRCQKADKRVAQANSKIAELEPSLQSSNRSSLSCRHRTNERQLFGVNHMISWVLIQGPLLADQPGKGRRARCSRQPSAMGASSQANPVHQYWLMNRCQ